VLSEIGRGLGCVPAHGLDRGLGGQGPAGGDHVPQVPEVLHVQIWGEGVQQDSRLAGRVGEGVRSSRRDHDQRPSRRIDAVFQQATAQMEAEVPFDPQDLPGYAARLVSLHERRPEIMRLCTWQRLERGDFEPNPDGVAFARAQIEAIAQAQKTGELPAHFPAGFLLGLVLHLCHRLGRGKP
jgi:hypothetical protein